MSLSTFLYGSETLVLAKDDAASDQKDSQSIENIALLDWKRNRANVKTEDTGYKESKSKLNNCF